MNSLMKGILPGFHAFIGEDQTERFAGKSKLKCWKTFQAVSDDIKEAFIELGKDALPSVGTEARMEQFVCQLYDPDTSLHEVAELRWKLFCKKQAEGEKLSPRGALHQTILRAHYQAMIWEADTEPIPNLPSPTNYGWAIDDGTYVPMPTLDPPAPKAVVELV